MFNDKIQLSIVPVSVQVRLFLSIWHLNNCTRIPAAAMASCFFDELKFCQVSAFSTKQMSRNGPKKVQENRRCGAGAGDATFGELANQIGNEFEML